jgi:hypothetical protein
VSNYIRASLRKVSFILCLLSVAGPAHSARLADGADELTASPAIVIGFVGGFVRRDAMAHSEVQLAAHLRHDYPSGVYAEVFENHRREKARAEIVRLVDVNHDGKLSSEEKRKARIFLYGHSWGASEVIVLSRELESAGIPVLLTVQVDSIAKPGENDGVIPANVAEAANFYQVDGWVRGQRQIRAADPARTRILGNFLLDYKANPIDCKEYPWYDRFFMRSHIEIECDPKVWNQVESLMRLRLPPQHP